MHNKATRRPTQCSHLAGCGIKGIGAMACMGKRTTLRLGRTSNHMRCNMLEVTGVELILLHSVLTVLAPAAPRAQQPRRRRHEHYTTKCICTGVGAQHDRHMCTTEHPIATMRPTR